ncbi:hypothetical protein [Paramesorhizobium deserti]|uniref:hypothetical protein n=1 Tax=Paramesorhizobium deserti TaxID=1494590 RepID=UPI00128FE0CC|nr:hypothetical protein [Paramesorhizobium deserti]
MNRLVLSKENPLFRPDPIRIGRMWGRGAVAGRGVGLRLSRTLAENAGHVFSSGSQPSGTGARSAEMVFAGVKEIAS